MKRVFIFFILALIHTSCSNTKNLASEYDALTIVESANFFVVRTSNVPNVDKSYFDYSFGHEKLLINGNKATSFPDNKVYYARLIRTTSKFVEYNIESIEGIGYYRIRIYKSGLVRFLPRDGGSAIAYGKIEQSFKD